MSRTHAPLIRNTRACVWQAWCPVGLTARQWHTISSVFLVFTVYVVLCMQALGWEKWYAIVQTVIVVKYFALSSWVNNLLMRSVCDIFSIIIMLFSSFTKTISIFFFSCNDHCLFPVGCTCQVFIRVSDSKHKFVTMAVFPMVVEWSETTQKVFNITMDWCLLGISLWKQTYHDRYAWVACHHRHIFCWYTPQKVK